MNNFKGLLEDDEAQPVQNRRQAKKKRPPSAKDRFKKKEEESKIKEFDAPDNRGKVRIDFSCSKTNQEVEYNPALTLNQRALILVQTDDYLFKVK